MPFSVILGAGHTRWQMGVYERLAQLAPGAKQLNLAFQETGGTVSAAAYFSHREAGGKRFGPAHEILWFTAPASDEDPCEQFREQLAKHRKGRDPGRVPTPAKDSPEQD